MKTLFISGATSGIGLETALYFSNQGWQVLATGRSLERLKSLKAKLNDQSETFCCDLIDPIAVGELIATINSHSKVSHLDALVNNAGIVRRKSFLEHNTNDFNDQIQTNFVAPAQIIQGLTPLLKKSNEPLILNISSNLGEHPIVGTSVYSATKAAINNLTQTLALELAPFGIRVNAICPGIVDTPIHKLDGLENKKEILQQMNAMTPIGRIGTATEMAKYIFQYTTEAFLWKTGSIDIIDGGIHLS